MQAILLSLLLTVLLGGRTFPAALPTELIEAQLDRLNASKESAPAPYPGLLLVPRGDIADVDGKYSRPFHAACDVYTAERDTTGSPPLRRYSRRFIVHAPDAEMLPLAKRVGRMLLLLHGETHERLRQDHPINERTVDVWLTRQAGQGASADAGGEQFKNQIYIYSLYSDRKPIEWAREVAHEYGHYALPGVTGYMSPEEWANGVLGERLYLKWLRDDLTSGKLKAEDLPIVTPEQLDEYISRQTAPLIRRIVDDGVSVEALRRRDAAGMDAYTALALYVDAVYGSVALLNAMASTTPAQTGAFIQAPDFLRGVRSSLQEAAEFTVTAQVEKDLRKAAVTIFLPRGDYTVAAPLPVRSWQFDSAAKGVRPVGKDGLAVKSADWRRLTVTVSADGPASVSLTFRRRGAEAAP